MQEIIDEVKNEQDAKRTYIPYIAGGAAAVTGVIGTLAMRRT